METYKELNRLVRLSINYNKEILEDVQKHYNMEEKTREYIDDITEYGWSDCCSAEVIMGDICSECREHCEIIIEDE